VSTAKLAFRLCRLVPHMSGPGGPRNRRSRDEAHGFAAICAVRFSELLRSHGSICNRRSRHQAYAYGRSRYCGASAIGKILGTTLQAVSLRLLVHQPLATLLCSPAHARGRKDPLADLMWDARRPVASAKQVQQRCETHTGATVASVREL